MAESNFKDYQTEKKLALRFIFTVILLILTLTLSFRYLGSVASVYTRGVEFQIQRVHKDLVEFNKYRNRKKDIVVIGDSTASKALNLQNVNSISFAVHGGSLIDGYFLFKNYLENYEPPKCVFIMTSYGAFDYHVEKMFWPVLVNNGFYSFEELQDIYAVATKTQDFNTNFSKLDYWIKVVVYYDWLNSFRFNDVQNFIYDTEVERSARRTYRSVHKNRGSYPVTWEGVVNQNIPLSTPAERHLYRDFKVNKTLDTFIYRLFELLNSNNVKTFILFNPLAEGLRASNIEDWVSDLSNHMGEMTKNYSLVENHIKAEFFDNGLFFDGTHLLDFAAEEYQKGKEHLIETCR